MAKAQPVTAPPKAQPKPAIERLAWPLHPRDLSEVPGHFRIERINAFEWQAFVTYRGSEVPIGKPDLFDILKTKVNGVMRAEGQREFLALKTKVADAEKPKAADAQ